MVVTCSDIVDTLSQSSMQVKKLLLEDMPKNDKNISKNDKYLSIKRVLEYEEVDVEIEFISKSHYLMSS